MLAHVAKWDEKYRAYAIKICRCPDLGNDLVQEMYLKLDRIIKEHPEKQITDSYIYLILYTSFIDHKRKYHPEHIEERILQLKADEQSDLCQRQSIDEALSEMRFFDREILLKTQEHSLRKVGKMLGCGHTTIYNRQQKALDELKSKIWPREQ